MQSTRIHQSFSATLLALGTLLATPAAVAESGEHDAMIERGRYLSKIAGCNDCHTPGYMMSDGNVAEQEWLTGDTMGWRGPWGTTYASNLRRYMDGLSEEQWIITARALKARPPMPWFNLNAMQEDDLRALYRFVRYLGPAGEPAPAYVPPHEEPRPPFAQFPAPPEPVAAKKS